MLSGQNHNFDSAQFLTLNRRIMKLTDGAGYQSNVFPGKQDQMKLVSAYVLEKGFIPKELIENEVSWFYGLFAFNVGIWVLTICTFSKKV
jgi:hypothetical protein